MYCTLKNSACLHRKLAISQRATTRRRKQHGTLLYTGQSADTTARRLSYIYRGVYTLPRFPQLSNASATTIQNIKFLEHHVLPVAWFTIASRLVPPLHISSQRQFMIHYAHTIPSSTNIFPATRQPPPNTLRTSRTKKKS